MKLSPLHDLHVELGAKFTEFAGWQMPLRYGSELREHEAVRQAAGLFDLSHMGEIVLVGPDAGKVLDSTVVSEVGNITPGRARYTMLCDDTGGVLDDVIVYRTGESRLLVVANAANVATVHSALLSGAEGADVAIDDETPSYALLALQGPLSEQVLGTFTSVNLGDLRNYHCAEGDVDGAQALIARTGYTGSAGFELFVAPEDGRRLWKALLSAEGVLPAGLAARDSLRLEAGMALYGNELGPQLTPYHAGLGRLVKLTKPSGFVGAEALRRVANSKISPLLVGMIGTPGQRSPRHDCSVIDPASGQVVGRVTSAAPSPTLGRPIALAYVEAEQSSLGTLLQVDVRGQKVAVEVTSLPFYVRD